MGGHRDQWAQRDKTCICVRYNDNDDVKIYIKHSMTENLGNVSESRRLEAVVENMIAC